MYHIFRDNVSQELVYECHGYIHIHLYFKVSAGVQIVRIHFKKLANLSLIPKPNKDHTLPQNFCPISVLNNDLKFLGRLLADRLEKVIPPLIHADQTGFMPGRQY